MQKKNSEMVEIHLGYFKQGDDLGHCLKEMETPQKALRAHALMLEAVVGHLNKVADIVADNPVEIQADTHSIVMTCDKTISKKLIKAGLAEKAIFE